MNVEKPSGNVRFANGSNGQEGFVQIKKNKEWGVICYGNPFIINLVCQELGFQSAKSMKYGLRDGKLKSIVYSILSFLLDSAKVSLLFLYVSVCLINILSTINTC